MFSVVAPAYNEEDVIADFVREVMGKLQKHDFELVVVDDGSTDGTGKILSRLQEEYANLRVVVHPENRGLGAALATGFNAARGDVIVTMDADLSHDPAFIPGMVRKVMFGHDVVVASRYVTGGGMEGVSFWRALISRSANAVIRLVKRWKVRDASSGFRAYRAELVKSLRYPGSGFSVQVEILRELFRKEVKVIEIPFVLRNRKAGRSKMRYLKLIPEYAKLLAGLR